MAGTTTNYGFPYPTSTDLVRNGATAIQSFADSVDTFIAGSEAFGKLFNFERFEDANNRTTLNCSTTPKNVTGATTIGTTVTIGKSGFFAVIVSGNANNTTTAANGWVLGAQVSGAGMATSDVELSGDITGTSRSGGNSIKFFDATGGATITIDPRVRVVQTGTADTIVVYQHKIQVVSFG
jgi:hypothetical protein